MAVDDIFGVVGGRPEIDSNAAEKGFQLGAKAGELRSQTGPAAFINNVVNARDKRKMTDATLQEAQTKARVAKIQDILLRGTDPNASMVDKVAAQRLTAMLKSNPDFAQVVGIDPSKSTPFTPPAGFTPSKYTVGGVTYESDQAGANERGNKAREIDFNLAAKANEDMAVLDTSLSSLEDMFKKAIPNPSADGSKAIMEGTFQNALSSVGMNEDLRSFNKLKDSMTSLFSKGLFREAGVLTNQDIQRAMASLPEATDSSVTLANKMATLRAIIQTGKTNYEAKRQAYISGTDFTPISSEMGSGAKQEIGVFKSSDGRSYKRFSDGSVEWQA